MSCKILITGGCGFLGQYITAELMPQMPTARILILDLKPNPAAVIDVAKFANVEMLAGVDITQPRDLAGKFDDVDTVIHLAGLVSFSYRDRDLLNAVNVEGTSNVLKAAQDAGVKRFLHVSSVAALGYRDHPAELVDEDFKFDWSAARKKHKYYMLSKHLADEKLDSVKGRGMDVTVFYPGLMFGPGDVTNSVKLITAIAAGKVPFNMPGGTNIVDVRDVARGISNALSRNTAPGKYLLSGYNLSYKEVNSVIAQSLAKAPPKITLPRRLRAAMYRIFITAEKLNRRKLQLTADNVDSAFRWRYFDNSRAAESLGWKPRISFEQTIRDTIDWMRQNNRL